MKGNWEPLNITETIGGDVVCHNCSPVLWHLLTAYRTMSRHKILLFSYMPALHNILWPATSKTQPVVEIVVSFFENTTSCAYRAG